MVYWVDERERTLLMSMSNKKLRRTLIPVFIRHYPAIIIIVFIIILLWAGVWCCPAYIGKIKFWFTPDSRTRVVQSRVHFKLLTLILCCYIYVYIGQHWKTNTCLVYIDFFYTFLLHSNQAIHKSCPHPSATPKLYMLQIRKALWKKSLITRYCKSS